MKIQLTHQDRAGIEPSSSTSWLCHPTGKYLPLPRCQVQTSIPGSTKMWCAEPLWPSKFQSVRQNQLKNIRYYINDLNNNMNMQPHLIIQSFDNCPSISVGRYRFSKSWLNLDYIMLRKCITYKYDLITYEIKKKYSDINEQVHLM